MYNSGIKIRRMYMKKFELNIDDKAYILVARIGHHTRNKGLSIFFETDKEEPFAKVTINFGDEIAQNEYQYVDIKSCPWAENFIQENGLGKPAGTTKCIDDCEYPLYKFNLEAFK